MLAKPVALSFLTVVLLPSLVAQPAPAPSPGSQKPDLSGQAMVIESIATVVRYAKDGSSVRTLAVTERVLSDAGVRDAGIITIPYASATETLTYDSVRVRKPSGEVIVTPADGAQETPLPVTQAAPMYSDLRAKQLPVKSLGVGDTLEYHVTLKDTNADAQGMISRPMWFTGNMPVRQEVVEVRTA